MRQRHLPPCEAVTGATRCTYCRLDRLGTAPDAGDWLEELHRKNYFTLKHPQAEPAYEYHPLFREFLLAGAKRAFASDQLQELRKRAAALAEADGQLETAAELLRACGDFRGVAELVLRHARGLLEQGRGQVVEAWLASLPAIESRRLDAKSSSRSCGASSGIDSSAPWAARSRSSASASAFRSRPTWSITRSALP